MPTQKQNDPIAQILYGAMAARKDAMDSAKKQQAEIEAEARQQINDFLSYKQKAEYSAQLQVQQQQQEAIAKQEAELSLRNDIMDAIEPSLAERPGYPKAKPYFDAYRSGMPDETIGLIWRTMNPADKKEASDVLQERISKEQYMRQWSIATKQFEKQNGTPFDPSTPEADAAMKQLAASLGMVDIQWARGFTGVNPKPDAVKSPEFKALNEHRKELWRQVNTEVSRFAKNKDQSPFSDVASIYATYAPDYNDTVTELNKQVGYSLYPEMTVSALEGQSSWSKFWGGEQSQIGFAKPQKITTEEVSTLTSAMPKEGPEKFYLNAKKKGIKRPAYKIGDTIFEPKQINGVWVWQPN